MLNRRKNDRRTGNQLVEILFENNCARKQERRKNKYVSGKKYYQNGIEITEFIRNNDPIPHSERFYKVIIK